jgi:hypothetical protein
MMGSLSKLSMGGKKEVAAEVTSLDLSSENLAKRSAEDLKKLLDSMPERVELSLDEPEEEHRSSFGW